MTDIEMNETLNELNISCENVSEDNEPDIVTVVRCKKCAFYNPKSGYCNIHLSHFTDNDFCNYGTKRRVV